MILKEPGIGANTNPAFIPIVKYKKKTVKRLKIIILCAGDILNMRGVFSG